MAGYRLYCLDEERHITHRADFDAADDDAAITYARTHHGEFDCEIWELGRRVAFVSTQARARIDSAASAASQAA